MLLMVFVKLVFVGFLMVLWPKCIFIFVCIFTFGALGLESPRAGAINYSDNPETDPMRKSATFGAGSRGLPKSQVAKRLQKNSRKFGSTKNLLRENGC